MKNKLIDQWKEKLSCLQKNMRNRSPLMVRHVSLHHVRWSFEPLRKRPVVIGESECYQEPFSSRKGNQTPTKRASAKKKLKEHLGS